VRILGSGPAADRQFSIGETGSAEGRCGALAKNATLSSTDDAATVNQ